MTDPDDSQRPAGPGDEEDDDEEYAATPFDNPYFLPVILLAFAIWFVYDGWLNADEHMQEWLAFNRWGAGITITLGVYFGIKALRERRADSD